MKIFDIVSLERDTNLSTLKEFMQFASEKNLFIKEDLLIYTIDYKNHSPFFF